MDIPILKYVDILIGLALVMVVVSTIVLAITQTLLNGTFARARHLQRGLRRVIISIEPTEMSDHALYLSRLIVRHPLIGQQTMFTPLRRWIGALRARRAARKNEDVEPLPPVSPGSIVQREELAYLMIEFAAGEGPLMYPAQAGETPKKIAQAQNAVAQALRMTGVEDPAATLRAIRLKVVENERAQPDQPSTRWRANAVADCATSDFLGKLHTSFDGTMTRVADGFTAESKLWVSAVALLVAVALQLDSFALLKRLSIDDAYRDTFVQVAASLDEERDAIRASDRLSPQQRAQRLASNEDSLAQARESLTLLGSPAINLLPRVVQPTEPATTWDRLRVYLPARNAVPGVLLSWVLLSLSAPFWFDMLKDLLKLRSLLARKDDAERGGRPTTQPPTPRPAPTPAVRAVPETAGEAGDLSATGAVG
ncbi:MAG TPA: hypothetical protein VGQ10_03210 [Vicinamibacterales bacterium]|nr:hypothetical protein [Vicinamibacterales bacterium]